MVSRLNLSIHLATPKNIEVCTYNRPRPSKQAVFTAGGLYRRRSSPLAVLTVLGLGDHERIPAYIPRVYHTYTTQIPRVYRAYTARIPRVYQKSLAYTARRPPVYRRIPAYTSIYRRIPVYTGVYQCIPCIYHLYIYIPKAL